ncbi:hypothetical protein PITCH_A1030001 [uncultured Desulfobacterium sp.]|uniref:Uncharacterized protein n=1 Tax=uncultured Desulfobacterium sp. TaxID=201089 RepID=A0A445MQT8_9BACT|nr:hypothetical protein PITCH_A1030001 [uncultured Desulfobacterium sp.]
MSEGLFRHNFEFLIVNIELKRDIIFKELCINRRKC